MKARRAQSPVKLVAIATALFAVLALGTLAILRFASPLVTLTEAVEGPVVQAFYSTGTIQPEREFPIKSNVAGILTEVKVDKGDRVKVGQPLAVISAPDLVFAAQKAQAELDEKQKRADEKTSPVIQELDAQIQAMASRVEIAAREEKRIQGLIDKNAANQTDLDRAADHLKIVWSANESLKAQRLSKLLELRRELDVAKSALDTAKWNLDQQTLKSPIDGVVLDRPLSLGTRVAINDRIMNVADITPTKLVMRAAVDEEDVVQVKPDQIVRMTLYSYANRAFEGRVHKIYDQADPERRTFEIDVKIIDPDPRLSPGMTGELAFEIGSKPKAVVIPSQAIQKGGGVFTVEDGKLKKLDVTLGLRGIERTEVVSGLTTGNTIVISAVGNLKDGRRVRTTRMDPVAAAGLNKPKAVNDSFKGFK